MTHEVVVEQTEAEGRELIQLHSDLERLAVEQRRRQRETGQQRAEGKESVARLKLERDEWLIRGEQMRTECVSVEEELEKEEAKQRQLRRAIEEKTAVSSRQQRVR